MDTPHPHSPSTPCDPRQRPAPLDLATAYAELQHLLLDGSDVVDFLHELSLLAAAIVPGTHCAITLRREDQVYGAAGSDAVALRMDELQYFERRGPCLQAMTTGERIDVTDMSSEERWGDDYRARALANGIRSVVSLPLGVDEKRVGALNLFSTAVDGFTEPDVARARAFTEQAATALTILLRHASRLTLDDELREALTSRAVIDQAIGILMHTHRIGAGAAFESLRQQSQTTNRKVSDLAAEIILETTGHPPEPPRPLSQRT